MVNREILLNRSGSVCELCSSSEDLTPFPVKPQSSNPDHFVLLCSVCSEQLSYPQKMEANHWRCLNSSMWSEVPAVQVMAWRILNSLRSEGWPQDLLDMLYLDEVTLAWAKEVSAEPIVETDEVIIHKDSNGSVLLPGDTVVLIKDLDVKGGGFTAKRGTAVRGISLVENNAGQIEGRVNGQQIVILTQYVKKSS